jgi:hypothetical protein
VFDCSTKTFNETLARALRRVEVSFDKDHFVAGLSKLLSDPGPHSSTANDTLYHSHYSLLRSPHRETPPVATN